MVTQAEKEAGQGKPRSKYVARYQPSQARGPCTRIKVYGAIPSEVFTSRKAFIKVSRQGIPGDWVKKAVEATGLREVFITILNVSSGNLHRIYNKQTLPPDTSEEVLDAVRVLQQAVAVWESEELAMEWLKSPVPALGGERPVNLFDTFEGRRWVSQVLNKIEHGEFS